MPLGRYSDDDTSPPSPGRPSAALPFRPLPTPAYLQPSAAHPLATSAAPSPSLAPRPPPPSAACLVAPFPFPLFPSLRTSASDLVAPRPSLPRLLLLSSLPTPHTRLIKRGKLPNEISIRLETRSLLATRSLNARI